MGGRRRYLRADRLVGIRRSSAPSGSFQETTRPISRATEHPAAVAARGSRCPSFHLVGRHESPNRVPFRGDCRRRTARNGRSGPVCTKLFRPTRTISGNLVARNESPLLAGRPCLASHGQDLRRAGLRLVPRRPRFGRLAPVRYSPGNASIGTRDRGRSSQRAGSWLEARRPTSEPAPPVSGR